MVGEHLSTWEPVKVGEDQCIDKTRGSRETPKFVSKQSSVPPVVPVPVCRFPMQSPRTPSDSQRRDLSTTNSGAHA